MTTTQSTFFIRFKHGSSAQTKEVEIKLPLSPLSHPTGKSGSLLDIALNQGINIDHACGGVAACSTCHVIVREGLQSCSEAQEDELDQLDEARGVTPHSRLACQCVPDGSQNLIVEIPTWNTNLVREGE